MASCERVFLNVSDTDGDEGKMAHQTKSLIGKGYRITECPVQHPGSFPYQ